MNHPFKNCAIKSSQCIQEEILIQNKPTLWGVDVSPFVRKVQIALKEKKISYHQESVLPVVLSNALKQDISFKFLEISPLGKIPVLEDGDFTISDSAVICAYLEEQYPKTKNLYPATPKYLAKALWFEKYADEILANVITRKIFWEKFVKPNVLNQSPNDDIVKIAWTEELPGILNYLEKALGEGDYMVGGMFSIADIAIVTHFVALHQVGYSVNVKEWPKLHSYINFILKRDSFSC